MLRAGMEMDAALPPGSRLLHIGPHKTGTTSLQGAFHRSRPAAIAQGVRYAGPNRHPVGAAQAVVATGRAVVRNAAAPAPRIGLWQRLVREVRSAPEARVVISSEWFADADDATIRRVVDDLDPVRTHVVLTVRPLIRILPSQWQQYVQAGVGQPYEAWLESVLRVDAPNAPSFWRRHRHDQLAARWAEVVGAERVTVVVADDRDHGSVLRAFERLTGLRRGTLVTEPAGANRSLTRLEIEAVRAMSIALGRAGVVGERQLNLVLYGAAAALRERTPATDEPRIETPAWATARARAIGTEIADGLVASGVRIVGGVDSLRDGAPRGHAEGADPEGEPDDVAAHPAWPEVVATATVGLATGAAMARAWPAGGRSPAVAELSTRRLFEVLGSRARRMARIRLPRAAQPLPDAAISSPEEAAVVAELERQVRELGIGRRQSKRIIAAVTAELGTPVAALRDFDLDGPWPRIAATAAVGIARASGLVPPPGHAPKASSRRATVETIELARLSTPALVAIVVQRLAAGAVRRRGAAAEPPRRRGPIPR
jgi:hypothetical protein